MTIGDVCRAHGAPARYVGYGIGIYVSSCGDGMGAGPAQPATGGEERLPLPDYDTVDAAAAALRLYARMREHR